MCVNGSVLSVAESLCRTRRAARSVGVASGFFLFAEPLQVLLLVDAASITVSQTNGRFQAARWLHILPGHGFCSDPKPVRPEI